MIEVRGSLVLAFVRIPSPSSEGVSAIEAFDLTGHRPPRRFAYHTDFEDSCLYFTTYSKLETIHPGGHYAYWLELNSGPLPFSMLSQADTVVCREDLTSRRQSLVRWQTPSLVSAFAFADNTLFAANATNFGAQPRDRPIPTRMDPRSLLTPKRSRWPVRHTNALRPHGSNAVASYDQRLASAPQESEPGAATSPEIENRHFA